MIRYLSIRRLAVIDQLELEFGAGLSVLTGETGAGKSILVEAVGLLLGGRATADIVRSGEETATVQAILELPDGSEKIVRREVSAQGRSRAFLDGELVTTAALRESLGDLVDLHGQHEHQALLVPATQLALLDRFAGLDDLRDDVAGLHAELVAARDALSTYEEGARDRAARLDLLEFQRHEIDKAAPKAGEDEALAGERQIVANADKLNRLASESYAALYDDDQAVLARLGYVWKRVGELAALDPSFQPFVEAREAVRAPLDDLARMLRDYAVNLDASPDRLQAIEDRLAAIERLKRRYGPTLDDVLARRRAVDEELQALDGGSDRLDALREAVETLASRYLARARALSASRRTAGDRFARALTAELSELAMGGTRCAVNLESVDGREADWTASGIDRLAFCLSPNVGEELRPLARIASGGELSRVMLAIKTLATTDVPGKTLVFDEVDAGVGGRAADAVGERLRALGRRGQVLCITHLPQVAACGDTHYRVSKAVHDGRTITCVERLGSEERIDEVARMMGGRDLSAKVRAGAQELILSRTAKAKDRAENRRAKGESERRKSTA
jgi:DNA repair protein RecN (Recombination protein N)